MKTRLVAAGGLFFAIAAAGAACSGETTTETRTAVEHGEVLFGLSQLSPAPGNKLACIDCHDADATHQTGGSLAGATSRPSYWGGSELTLLGAVNHCRYYFMLADTPWTGEEVEARAIYAYLESLPGDGAAAPFSIGSVVDPGPGDAGRGKAVYETACASCHGAKGTGEDAITPTAPVLPDETLAAHPPASYTDAERRLVFIQKTRHGTFLGYGGQMPPFSLEVLSDAELADLLTYMGVP
ncbi:MAG: c-type cytochrome [Polyangiaceae bacterium]|nr:c-type cytochrome [Polyangiaceae bacterium]